jgi:predicted acyl esterase
MYRYSITSAACLALLANAITWQSNSWAQSNKPNATGTYMVAMRDGTQLATDAYVPDGDGPWPVILLRFPYNKALGVGVGPDANRRGFVFVAQDTRGRYLSEGENLPFDADGQADGKWDGFDTAQWISEQPWCNGKIGTWGGSAGAITQYLLAGTSQPNVVSQHLVVGSPSLYRDGIYRGGIFRQAMVTDWLSQTHFDDRALELWTTPYALNQYWKDREISDRFQQVQPAGMHIGGWFDIFAQSTVDAFVGYQTQGAPTARGHQKLIMGPWTHGVLQKETGELTFPGADRVPNNLHDPWLWFDATLRDQTNAISSAKAVTYYVMGDTESADAPGNEWRTADQWPPLPTTSTPLFLHADHSASFSANFSTPNASQSLTITSDPLDPVPTIGGYELTIPAGPRNQNSIEARPDLLVFTSEPLHDPLELTGNVRAILHLTCTTPDADLIVRICDVYPNGKSYNICEGALRLRFRNGLDKESPLPLNQPFEVELALWPTSIIFNSGHRIRVHVAASNAPALQPNAQNGLKPGGGYPQTSQLSLLTGPSKSYLLLPVPKPAN